METATTKTVDQIAREQYEMRMRCWRAARGNPAHPYYGTRRPSLTAIRAAIATLPGTD